MVRESGLVTTGVKTGLFSFLKTTDVAESGLLNVFYMIYVNTVESIQHEQ